jgi:hypothetical protein
MNNGQKAIDKYTKNYNILRKKGWKQIENFDEAGEKYYTYGFDINRLSPTERRQYLVANAVKSRESALAPYIGTYAQAVSEGTGTLTQEYRYNRYALRGAKGGGSTGGKGGAAATPITYAPDSIAAQEAKVQELTKAWREASAEMRDGYLKQLKEAQYVLDDMKNPISNMMADPADFMNSLKGNLYENNLDQKVVVPQEASDKIAKAANPEKNVVKLDESLGSLASGMSQIVGGMEQLGIDIPEGIKSAVNAVQGVSTILTGISTTLLAIEALSAADTIIPFARGGIVPHAAAGYFVGGGHYSGDVTPVMANAGELILNKASQLSLASQLQNPMGNMNLTASLSGETITLAVKAGNLRRGRGEYVTSKTKSYGYNLDA